MSANMVEIMNRGMKCLKDQMCNGDHAMSLAALFFCLIKKNIERR